MSNLDLTNWQTREWETVDGKPVRLLAIDARCAAARKPLLGLVTLAPGDHGYSHCFNHQPPEVWIPELIRNEYDRTPDNLGCPGFESEWDDGADEIARKILERLKARALIGQG